MGGWREPGLAKEGPAPPVVVPAPAPAAAAPVAARPVPVRPEATRPQIATAAKVASFEGAAPQFSPSNFGDLLDASLGL